MVRIFVLVGVLLLLGVVSIEKSGLLSPKDYGAKIAGKPVVAATASAPTGLASLAPSVEHQPAMVDDKKKDTVVVFYRFVNRPVPSGLGSSDLPSNSVYKEVDKTEVASLQAEWRALDVPLATRKVRIQIIEVLYNTEDGFSLVRLATALEPVVNQATTSITSVGGTIASSTPQGQFAGLSTDAIQATIALLQTSYPSLRAKLRIKTTIQFTNGYPARFSDYAEQATPTTVTTQTAVSTSTQTRQVGLDISITPFITEQECSLSYAISNSQPDSDVTQSGATVSGQVQLRSLPVTILDSERVSETHEVDRLFGVPVGTSKTATRKIDIITMTAL